MPLRRTEIGINHYKELGEGKSYHKQEKGVKTMTQNDMILRHLKTHKRGITQADAVERFGCYRLSGRIHDLRELGYDIKTEHETKKNRYGVSCTFARYKLVQ